MSIVKSVDDELNTAAKLEYVYQFCYQARFSEAGSENELCHVYLGKIDGDFRPNDSEIESTRFISAVSLDDELNEHPQRFTPWFIKEWKVLKEDYAGQLARYAM